MLSKSPKRSSRFASTTFEHQLPRHENMGGRQARRDNGGLKRLLESLFWRKRACQSPFPSLRVSSRACLQQQRLESWTCVPGRVRVATKLWLSSHCNLTLVHWFGNYEFTQSGLNQILGVVELRFLEDHTEATILELLHTCKAHVPSCTELNWSKMMAWSD